MNRWTGALAMIVITMLIAMGCSGGGVSPVTPGTNQDVMTESSDHTGQTQTHLWGYYDIYIDVASQTAEVVVNRNAMFSANVVTFLNSNPAGVGVANLVVTMGVDYADCELDILLTHPLTINAYDGYDVRGIFIGDSSADLDYSGSLDYAVLGTDQYMFNEDGYTRWFNPGEFPFLGVMGYTPGAIATPGYTGNATLNPYKYFADGLSSGDDLWDFLMANAGDNGIFSANTTNDRHYDLRFPMMTTGVKFNYAVVANWLGEDPADHPSNATESVGISTGVTPDIYFVDAGDNGGDLILDMDVWGWSIQPSTIWLESEVLPSAVEVPGGDMIPVGGDANYSTYHTEIPATAVTYNSVDAGHDSEFWVICVYPDDDYSCSFTPPGGAPSADLAAFFRYDLYIHNEAYNMDPICDIQVVTAMPVSGYVEVCVEFDATASIDPDGTIVLWEWDFDGDDVFGDTYNSGTDDNPIYCYDADYVGPVCLQLTDDLGAMTECCVDLDVEVLPLYNEDFTTDPGDWCLATYQYWSGCTQGAPCWRGESTIPFGVAAGCLCCPCVGIRLWGGALATFVSPSFYCPSSTEVTFRCRPLWDLGGSYAYYTKTNFAVASSTASGCAPFSTTNCSGGTIMSRTTAHGGASPAGWVSSGGSGPCSGYAGWRGNYRAWPGQITAHLDLVIPASFHDTDIKVAYRCHPDWCYYPGNNDGIVIDDVELMLW